MVKLIIIADDFTGALDTAVQFASDGANTKVIINTDYEISKVDQKVEVLVINAETRHLTPEEAYKVVFNIASQAFNLKIPYIFKKTDSALRGNIGSELSAVADASMNKSIHFIPAFPQIGRITKNGIHYIEGTPVHESVFGKDPFEPVRTSNVVDIISDQSDISVALWSEALDQALPEKPSIYLHDIETEAEISSILNKIIEVQNPVVIAGCAGLASVLTKKLSFEDEVSTNKFQKNNLLVVCGSVNPITLAQLDFAEKNGYHRVRLSEEHILDDDFLSSQDGKIFLQTLFIEITGNKTCIIDSIDDVGGEAHSSERIDQLAMNGNRTRISSNIGKIIKALIEKGLDSTIMITGGDTLMGFINQTDIKEIRPIEEIASGTVLFTIDFGGRTIQILSKSGGFGDEKLLVTLAERMVHEGRDSKVC